MPIPPWRVHKMAQLLWKTAWLFLTKPIKALLFYSAVTVLGIYIYPSEFNTSYSYKDLSRKFIVTVLELSKLRRN